MDFDALLSASVFHGSLAVNLTINSRTNRINRTNGRKLECNCQFGFNVRVSVLLKSTIKDLSHLPLF